MLSKDMLLTLSAYSRWANARLFASAAAAGPAAWEAPAAAGQRSLRELLFHIVRTEWLWRSLIIHQARPAQPPRLEDFPALADLRAFAQAEADAWQTLVESLDEAGLAAAIPVTDASGTAAPLVRWHMLLQPLLHGVQHRGEAGLLLAELGHSPGDLDFIFFV